MKIKSYPEFCGYYFTRLTGYFYVRHGFISSFVCIALIVNIVLGGNLVFKPIIYATHKTAGGSWHPKKAPMTIAGWGVKAKGEFKSWELMGEFINNGVFGVAGDPFSFSPEQGLQGFQHARDIKKTSWFDLSNMKVSYTVVNIDFEFGKFDRHWGPGLSSLIFSEKPPSYPQVGFDWQINDQLRLKYFHGFLKSGIPDSIRTLLYQQVGERRIDVSRTIAAHRIEWTPWDKIQFGATELVIYATRGVDVHYLLPFIPFWSLQHYLGDTDNIQMSADVTWQAGLRWQRLFKKSDQLTIEWTWTDHRVYRHRFSINDYYSNGYPLGFWAGPHAEELFIEYSLVLYDTRIILSYSNTKRGQLTDQMLEDQYNTVPYQRFSGPVNYEHLQTIDLLVKRKIISGLIIEAGVSHLLWNNAGFDPFNPEESVEDVEKISLIIGFSYNFNYPGRNRIHYE
ncbi:MAG: hypothetical protein IIA61_07345 [Candidatus Marinimicrobia bacterium]|nr:hypothetical protein [Candidatus Neomarinimicrobiota bacterium]